MPSASFVMELPPYHRPSLKWTSIQMFERAKIFVTDAGKIILAMSIVLWFLASYPKSEDSAASPAQKIEQSFAGKIGKFIEPAIKPLGYDWKIGIGLLTSFAAREVMVSTLATIYNVEGADETSGNLKEALKNDRDPETGELLYSPLMAVSLMVFFVLACQCIKRNEQLALADTNDNLYDSPGLCCISDYLPGGIVTRFGLVYWLAV